MVGTHDYSGVNTRTQHQGGPIGNFWNWVFSKKADAPQVGSQGSLGNADSSATGLMPGIVPKLQLSRGNADNNWLSNSKVGFGAFADNISALQSVMADSSSKAFSNAASATTINAPITVEGAQVSVTINGSNVDDKLKAELTTLITSEIDKTNRSIPGIAQGAATDVMRNTFGAARAQQAER
jgi:hypothetical protein